MGDPRLLPLIPLRYYPYTIYPYTLIRLPLSVSIAVLSVTMQLLQHPEVHRRSVTPPPPRADQVQTRPHGQQASRFTVALQRMCKTAAPLVHFTLHPQNRLIVDAGLDIVLVEILLKSNGRVDVVATLRHRVTLSCVTWAREVTQGKTGAAGG